MLQKYKLELKQEDMDLINKRGYTDKLFFSIENEEIDIMIAKNINNKYIINSSKIYPQFIIVNGLIAYFYLETIND